MERHAEVVGAGFGGLAAAIALARSGWTVRLHERAGAIRSTGAGIYIYENGLRVLEALGAADAAIAGAVRVTGREVRERGRVVSAMRLPPGQRVYCVARQRLVEALAATAEAAGVTIALASEAVSASPDGAVVFASGDATRADLVVAADGVNSKLRDGLALLATQRRLPDGAIRVMASRNTAEETGPGMVVEAWAGTRRILYTPCTDDEVYMALCARHDDARGRATPVDVAAWSGWFPDLAPMLARLQPDARYDRFEYLTLKSWSAGRVAVIGDAAHAMPPNIGQGAGCALMNALSLAASVTRSASVPDGLASWERAERPLTVHTQRVSIVFGLPATWPSPVRTAFYAAAARFPGIAHWKARTSQHVPVGPPAPAATPASAETRP